MENGKTKKIFFLILGLGVLFALLSFGRNYHKTALNDLREQITKRNDSIILLSQKRYDSVLELANTAIEGADLMREDNDRLRTSNNNLYYELKKQKRLLRVIDTSFVNNAERISVSTDKFYQRNDSIR